MANEEQLSILREGVEVWNKWRGENTKVYHPDLNGAKLMQANLNGVNLIGANLIQADLHGANLSNADLRGADLRGASLRSANLRKANLICANLSRDYLILVGDELISSSGGSELKREPITINIKARESEDDSNPAQFAETSRVRLDLKAADLFDADLAESQMGETALGDVDLSTVSGLEEIKHYSASILSIGTIRFFKGKNHTTFLQGCGLSDADIEYSRLNTPDLSNEEINKIVYKIYDLRATQAIQISPLFISYSHSDSQFVNKLEIYLNKKGIRFWRDVHEMKSGRIEKQIDRAIELNPTVLLVLSKHSIKSDWVEHEVRQARKLEKKLKRDVVCPVTLDNSWKKSFWPERIMEQVTEYNILDFTSWKDDRVFDETFKRLIDGLQLFYQS
jgi:uncharacterized protein YjbI with pentapeptide repeats